jgi:FlaA1/EpsC-like NDP-sugar epimerase
MLARRRSIVIRNRYFVIGDLLLTALSATLGFAIRLDVPLFWTYLPVCVSFVLIAMVIKPPIYYLFGLYRRYWRYASIQEMLSILGAATTASAILSFLVLGVFLPLGWFDKFPRSVLIIDWLLSLLFVGGIRFSVRFAGEFGSFRSSSGRVQQNGESRRVLIMGAGDAGAMVVREMQANPGLGFVPVGLLDDNHAKVGMTIHGVLVQGSREDLPRLVREKQIDEVFIAMPAAPGRTIREVVAICQQAGVVYKTMPGIYELISGQVSVKQLREVRIEDLLRRSPVQIDGGRAEECFSDSVVLVTGAGGSIGSELCRQIARYRPRELLLLGHGENSIHRILLELRERLPYLAVRPLIADVRDQYRLREILTGYQPEVVFHTAAHKHVPLMEANVSEAVMNNVFGTLSLLQAAEANDVGRFVLVSSDKAVNPINIMGATKRVAELMVQDTAQRTGRAYVAVRFGNVLGSRGSVVPLFQRQIAAQGPVTVTHPEMERYFMTIPEAVQLIIQAAVVGRGGEIFVLDMGESVRVVDLATELIRLSGLEPGRDIAIAFTGPRPGEKLREELFANGQERRPTEHPKILVAQGNGASDHQRLSRHLEEMRVLAREGNLARIQAKIQEIVPEYKPHTLQTQDSPGA